MRGWTRLAAPLVLLAVRPAGAAPLGLAEALERAVARAPEALAADAPVAIARADVRTAGMLANPALTFTGDRSEPVFSASAAFRLPIFGQRGAEVRAAERGVRAAEAEAQLARWRLRHDARVAYYSIARADEEVQIARAIEQLTGRVADMARERFEVGAGSRLDEEQAALVHARAVQEIVDRGAAADVARLELGRLIGLPAASIGALEDPLEGGQAAPPLETLLATAHARHPELAALDRGREAALARASAARAARRPLPTLELGIELLEPVTCGNDPVNGARCVGPRGALSFDLPVLNWNGGPIARAEAEARLAELRGQAAAWRVEAEVRAAWRQLDASRIRARFFDAEFLPAANRVEQMAREGFTSGRTGLLPLLEAERAVLEARIGRVEALFALQQARADLEEASGVELDAR
jgi:cobalt-zinc-cadmium efflux system outer membrane protein